MFGVMGVALMNDATIVRPAEAREILECTALKETGLAAERIRAIPVVFSMTLGRLTQLVQEARDE